ncbi:tetratricopeptide repeat protein [Yinghuangia sp. ASG 101]|uniref:tetratricopeptide repeat protein n=1 Tax=Yinghuangia sp. ASG 101 TaxID=2896848 RepID=UPI001E487E23|nr:tetratricopeptide repeat protein [Yinghuangia sp. ASG 101]UGQ14217.1 tetratricopeptide repeat protein [Yinghuangia sp. ASG 101]
MQPRNMSMRGVVDLGAVKAASEAAAQRAQRAASAAAQGGADGTPGGAPAGSYVVDLTEQNFDSVLALSQQAPVVLEFSSQRSPHSVQLGAVFDQLADEFAGRFLLARLDIDASPQLAQELVMQAGIQGLPAAVAVIAGQLAPMFDRAAPQEEQLRQILDQLVAVGEQRFGLTGLGDAPAEAPGDGDDEPVGDPLLAPAEAALDAGDFEGAAQAYRDVLSAHPAHTDAKLALAQVELILRTQGVDAADARRKAADNPTDVAAQTLVADLDVAGGHIEDAFGRLVDTVRRTTGDDRNKARVHLLGLFDVVGNEDPRVVKGRTALTSVLF